MPPTCAANATRPPTGPIEPEPCPQPHYVPDRRCEGSVAEPCAVAQDRSPSRDRHESVHAFARVPYVPLREKWATTSPSQLDMIEHMCYTQTNNAGRHRSRVLRLRHNVQSPADGTSAGLSIGVLILNREKPQNKYRYRTLPRCQGSRSIPEGSRRIAAVAREYLDWHAEAVGYLLFERFCCPLRWNCRGTTISRVPGPAV